MYKNFNQIIELVEGSTESKFGTIFVKSVFCNNAKVYFNENTIVLTGDDIDLVYLRNEIKRFEMCAV